MRLLVPHIQQEKQMNCWHASGRMLWAYKYQQSINPLPNRYEDNTGIGAAEFINLAKELGLQTLPQVNQSFGWQFIDNCLRAYGPLWSAGQWNGANHIVVVTGVDEDGTLHVNDPAFPTPVIRTVTWFNERIDKNVPIPMMYLP